MQEQAVQQAPTADPLLEFATYALPFVFALTLVVVVLKLNDGTIELRFFKGFIEFFHRKGKHDDEPKELPSEPDERDPGRRT